MRIFFLGMITIMWGGLMSPLIMMDYGLIMEGRWIAASIALLVSTPFLMMYLLMCAMEWDMVEG